MKLIIKIPEGHPIPNGARFLSMDTEPDETRARYVTEPSPGIMGMIPIFGTVTDYKITPKIRVFFYEIDEAQP